MKRDRQLQAQIMSKIIDADFPRTRFECFSDNAGGYEDVDYPSWTKEEAHNIELLVLENRLAKEIVKDAPWLGSGGGEVYAESYLYVTPDGYDWFENRGMLRRVTNNISGNVPTIIVAVLIALLSAWSLQITGLSK